MIGLILLLGFGLISKILYYKCTQVKKHIYVKKKYIINNEILKIIDGNDIEYQIEQNIWVTKHNMNIIWNKLLEDHYVTITYYGIYYHQIIECHDE